MLRGAILALLAALTARAQCPSSLSPRSVQAPASSTYKNSFAVAALGTCSWAAVPAVSWITIDFGGIPGNPSTGNGRVGYTVQPNRTPLARTGSIRVGGLSFDVSQPAGSCSISISPQNKTFDYKGGADVFQVLTTCQWSPVSSVPWISATGGATGSGTASYTVSPNPSTIERTGTINIWNTAFSVRQTGAPCNITLSPPSRDVASAAASGSINVTATPGCAWTAKSDASWLQVVAGSAGSGNGAVSYSVQANTFALARTATISVSGANFTLHQAAASNCDFALTPRNFSFESPGGSATLQVATSCSWTPQASAPWIRLASSSPITGAGSVAFQVEANATPALRTAVLAVGTASAAITQNPQPCIVTLDPRAASVPASASVGTVAVRSPNACWTAESFAPWLRITAVAQAGGAGTVSYAFDANPSAEPRTGLLRIGPENFPITQAGAGPTFTAAGVAHGATALAGPVSPGEIIVIYGSGLGPEILANLELTPDGAAVTTELAGTRVWFGDAPAPLIYTSAGQVSAVVPYSVAGKSSVDAIVEFQGARSSPVRIPVAPVSPGIFTANQSGLGQGAILNEDNSYNNLQPAARGSIIQVFCTGEGATEPPGADGKLAVPPYPKPVASVTAAIGGLDADVIYAGAAPGLVAGVLQVNLRVPLEISGGDIPVQIRVGNVSSRPGVTVSLR